MIKKLFLLALNGLAVFCNAVFTRYVVWKDRAFCETFVYLKKGEKAYKFDLYLPDSGSEVPLIIFLHGGAWWSGSRKHIEPLCLEMRNHGYAIASVSYSRSGRAKFPNQLQEIKEAYSFLKTNEFNVNFTDEIVFWGVSAGAFLTNLAVMEEGIEAKKVISFYSPSHLPLLIEQSFLPFASNFVISYFLGYNCRSSRSKAENAVINIISGKDQRYLIFQGQRDMIVPEEQSAFLNAELRRNGYQTQFELRPDFYHGDLRLNYGKDRELILKFLLGGFTAKAQGLKD